ncbi:hypothetical protein [Streptomyces caatingaensis]|uniref:N-acetyltransferase domain-containing protein n=1 Tax=Streptomyces caatingaensis TaxID=1678637 RepID=A0A0K9XBP0_9ACTN|nr:hypothetical protein [Streptomyces caatingaensis]KNB50072.1 hypothetical protein AC230_25525 [Streptomyces caatingaensis]
MAFSIEIVRDADDERTLAVVLGHDTDTHALAGSVTLLDLGAEDPALRIVALPEVPREALVPLMREAAAVAREAGGTVLRWVTESEEEERPALEELGAVEGDEVHRWWRLETTPTGPAPDAAPAFRVTREDALFDVEFEGDTAILAHDRVEDGTVAGLTELVTAALEKVLAEHPGTREVLAYSGPDDDVLNSALSAAGFARTPRRAVEYGLPL